MNLPLVCDDDDRRRAVRAAGTVNGIDFLEVADASQTVLDVTFLHPLPGQPGEIPAGPELEVANLMISGGVRIMPIEIINVERPAPNMLRINVSEPGDFSPYRLAIIAGAGTDAPPPGFDPTLSSFTFSFKAACPTDLPCDTGHECMPVPSENPVIDYLAKDYDSFRSLILARLRQVMPEWQDTSPADPYIACIEALAYSADRLSYMQDAAGAEAYLATARNRVSVSRHARLVDYQMHNGVNARTFVAFEVNPAADSSILPAGTPLISRMPALGTDIDGEAFATALQSGAQAFATLTDVSLFANHGHIAFHTWSRRGCCLPIGAMAATLADDPALSLSVGDYLVLIQTAGPETGASADADPDKVHFVRLTSVVPTTDPLDGSAVVEIEWGEEDALPFDLPLSGAAGTDGAEIALAEAGGNIALADHGAWVEAELSPDVVPQEEAYRPCILLPGVTQSAPVDPAALSARAALISNPRQAVPEIRMTDPTGMWFLQRDLLASDRFANDVVAELDRGGFTRLRFGDDINGRKPTPLNRFTAEARIGTGTAGNVGRGVISHVVSAHLGAPVDGILRVTNPIPGQGGVDPEKAARVRLFAPASIRQQNRAVTDADWTEWALRHPGVQRASAELRWTGSWYTVFITVDRVGGGTVTGDPDFSAELIAFLGRARIAGYDLELRDPLFVPLQLTLRICVQSDFARADVRVALLDHFSSGLRRDGSQGFFHPDAFTFGDPVYTSQIYAAAMAVSGVASVEIETFQRWGGSANGEITAGIFRPGDREIVELQNDPNFPERGVFEAIMEGSL